MIASTYVHVTSCIYCFLFIVTFIARTRGKARWSRALLRGLVKTVSVYICTLFFFVFQPLGITLQVPYVKAASLRGPGQTKKFTIHDRRVFHSRITVFSRRATRARGGTPPQYNYRILQGRLGAAPPGMGVENFFRKKKISKLSFPDMGLYVNYINNTSNFYAFCLVTLSIGRQLELLAIRVRPIPNFSSHV